MTALVTDHSEVSAMADVVSLNPFQQIGTRYGLVRSFWATPERAATDPRADVLEITFTGTLRVNWVQFDLARFPHIIQVQYYDETIRGWRPVIEVGGSEATRRISSVSPGTLPPPKSVQGHQHPQHSFAGHWHTEALQIVPTDMSRMRLLLNRIPGKGPIDIYGNRVSYSLAVRDLSVGYQVTSLDDVPRTLPVGDDNGAYSEPFASTEDAAGSTVQFRTRTLDASRAILDNAPDATWRCEPQPDPNCVVSLYADVRNANRQAQVIDRVYIDPVNVGAHLSLYFCQQTPVGNFFSGPRPLDPASLSATQNAVADDTGLHFASATGYPSSDSLILDNAGFDYHPDVPWWVGMVVTPHFDMPVTASVPSATNAVFFDCGAWSLAWTDTGLLLQVSTGDQVPVPIYYQNSLQTTVFVSFDGTGYNLWARNEANVEGAMLIASEVLDEGSVQSIALGSDLERAHFGQSDILSLVIKQERPPADGEDYDADPRAYTQVSEYPVDEPATSRTNALLRFDPQTTICSPDYPWRIFGGGHSLYEQMVWTPVPRDYTCHRGWLRLPPVRAKYFKLEFTRLQPVYSDVLLATQQLVRRFPLAVEEEYRQRIQRASAPQNATDDLHGNLASYINYVDTPSVVSTGGTGQGFTNTEVYLADDPGAADRLYAAEGENWSFQHFASPLTAPRFSTTGVHVYRTELVARTSKIAYVVGLSDLRFARSSHTAAYDVPQYVDEFLDASNLDTDNTSWVFDGDRFALTSSSSTDAQIRSQVMPSNRQVRGLQFAAQQSPPQQMLRDAYFSDPRHQRWTAVGDARIERGVKSAAFDILIPVERVLSGGFWEDLAPQYGTWGAIEAAGAKWRDLATGSGHAPSDPGGNGIASEAVTVPDGGYAYAAARVYADQDLFAPLWLQIVDSVTGMVLSEEPFTVARGRVAEWYTSYELNTGQVGSGTTWGQLGGGQFTQTFSDTFNRANSTGLGKMDSGQPWVAGVPWAGGVGTQLDVVSNAATVNVPGARSVVDVGNSWGTLTINLGNLQQPGTAVELATLGTLILKTNGQVVDPNTGYVYTTLTLAAGDSLQFTFLPTVQVPGAQTSGADPNIRSWSVVISRNGSFVVTVSTAQPLSTVRGLAGSTGQTFASFTWNPSDVFAPSGTQIFELPVPRDGGFNATGDVWTESSTGRAWSLAGSFNQVPGPIVQSIQAPAGLSFEFDTDVGDLYGAMTFQVTLSGTSPAANYYVAKLDDTPASQLYLRADGALMQNTPTLGMSLLKSGAVPSFSGPTTVLFAQTSKLPSSFRSTYGLSSSYDQTLVFLNGTTVVGTYQGNELFLHTVRGVMGTDGSMISGFTWGPNLGSVNTGSGVRTWDNISGQGTLTWADVVHAPKSVNNPLTARVVQKVATQDTWYMDALAIFIDPIVWEFSNDGGKNWIPASTIRNNPNAAVMFDVTGPLANALCYRVTSYAADTWLSHLVIRPWYVGYMRDAPVLAESPDGPNMNPLDDYLPVDQDPNFMVWSGPIPREFFFAFRSLLPGIEPGRLHEPFASERIVAG